MRKFAYLFLCLIMVVAFVGCGDDDDKLAYTGSTDFAEFTDDNIEDFVPWPAVAPGVVGKILTMTVGGGLGGNSLDASEWEESEVPLMESGCNDQGTLTIRLLEDTDSEALMMEYILEDFLICDHVEYSVINGRLSFVLPEPPDGMPCDFTLNMDMLRMDFLDSDGSFTIHGDVEHTCELPTPPVNGGSIGSADIFPAPDFVNIDAVVRDNNSGNVYKYEYFMMIDYETYGDGCALAYFGGDFYHPAYGYVEVEPETGGFPPYLYCPWTNGGLFQWGAMPPGELAGPPSTLILFDAIDFPFIFYADDWDDFYYDSPGPSGLIPFPFYAGALV